MTSLVVALDGRLRGGDDALISRDRTHSDAHPRSAIIRVAPPLPPLRLEAPMSRSSRRSTRAPALLLALAAAISAPVQAASAAVAPPASVVVAVPLLNLRAAPRLSAPVLRRLPRGTVLRLRFYHVSWAAVTAPDDTIGYVDRYAVHPLAAAPAPVALATVTPARAPSRRVSLTVATATANLRATPDLAAPILATLPRQTPLTLLGVDRTGTWARVATHAGRVGWCKASD